MSAAVPSILTCEFPRFVKVFVPTPTVESRKETPFCNLNLATPASESWKVPPATLVIVKFLTEF